MSTRKGLSTVVGTVFAIIALTTTITYVSYSMGILDNYNQSVLAKNQQLSDINKEKFQISSVTVPNNKLNVTIANTGSLPINFTKIWVQNMSATDWVNSYTPTNNFVAPGGVLTKLGQKIPVYINSANSYNVKLVTSRGNTQQFSINSISAQPLSIQLLALPSTIPSGFVSELVMIITNNSTNTLINVSPNDPTLTINNVANDSPTCVSSGLTPTQYTTISPGTTVVFKWDITVTGSGGDSCTASFTTPLKGGYSQALTSPAIKPTSVSLSSTTYAQNSGVITNDYTSFRWTEGNTWNTDWSVLSTNNIDFQTTMSNNNQTAGGYYLWLSKQSQIVFVPTFYNGNSVHPPSAFFIVNSIGLANGQGCSSPYPCLVAYTDYSKSMANQGGLATLYFGALTAGSNTQTGALSAGNYYGFIILYGKFCKQSTDLTCGNYAQTIPFYAIISS